MPTINKIGWGRAEYVFALPIIYSHIHIFFQTPGPHWELCPQALFVTLPNKILFPRPIFSVDLITNVCCLFHMLVIVFVVW